MKRKPSSFPRRQFGRAGSILIYVLWLSALLGLFTLAIGSTVSQKLKMIERVDSRRALRLAAESGVQRGLWAVNRPSKAEIQADTLSSLWSHGDTIFRDIDLGPTRVSVIKPDDNDAEEEAVYGLVDEESKVNINLIKDSEILKRLFLVTAGMTEEEASVMADSILDWIDEDEHVNASGAENQYYRGLKRPIVPKNATLDTLEELLYIRGVTPGNYKQISLYLTLFGDGKVNLNTASKPVLMSVAFDQGLAELIVNYRLGPDHQIATKDDGVFYNPNELIDLARDQGGADADSIALLENLLARGLFKVTSDYYAVHCEASRQEGKELLTARVVIHRRDGVQAWSERLTHH